MHEDAWSWESDLIPDSISAGDVDGDGTRDVVLGLMDFDTLRTTVLVFRATSGRFADEPDVLEERPPMPARTLFPAGPLVADGDVDGDGRADVAARWGTVEVLLSSGSWVAVEPPAGSLFPEGDLVNFGNSLAFADVDGDGYSDLLVGGERRAELPQGSTAAFLYLGGPAGLEPEPTWERTVGRDSRQPQQGVVHAGDMNGDGFADVAIAGWGFPGNPALPAPRLEIFLGSADGLPRTPSWAAEPQELGLEFGTDIAAAGDVNGDGFDDLLLRGRDLTYAESGMVGLRAIILLGGTTETPATSPGWLWKSTVISPPCVGSAGDVDGDGFGDVFACEWADLGEDTTAAVRRGSRRGVRGRPTARFEASSIQSVDDVNVDGYDDFVVQCVGLPVGSDDQRANLRLIFGGPDFFEGN